MWSLHPIAENDILPTLITLRPKDFQAIMAGLAANPNAMATMAHFMARAASTTGSSDQLVSSSSSQGLLNGKLHATITTIRDELLLTHSNPVGSTPPHMIECRIEGVVEGYLIWELCIISILMFV